MGCYREIFSAVELLPSVSRVIVVSQSHANSVLVAKKVTISEMASARSILSCRVGPFLRAIGVLYLRTFWRELCVSRVLFRRMTEDRLGREN